MLYSHPILLLVLPLLFALALLEAFWLSRRQVAYPWKQTGATAVIALGQNLSAVAFGGGVLALLGWVARHSLWTIPMDSGWAWLALFLGVDFTYYWFHRASHLTRWFWATHAVHHTPEHMVLSGALRLGWTSAVSGAFAFYIPLVWLGFPPSAVMGTLAASLLYQFLLHTEMVPKLGALEWVFNTPSHHRVHHARNPRYLDANFGGVLIVFDRLFGSFVAEDASEPCDYGLVHPLRSEHPLRIVFAEWLALARDLRSARSVRDVVGFLFRAPGWRPDGSGSTTAALRAAAARSAGLPSPSSRPATRRLQVLAMFHEPPVAGG